MDRHHFVFVAGLHKSGTTVLTRCLGEHPQISSFQGTGVPKDEGQHLQSVYPPGPAFGSWGRFGFHPQAHLTESSELVSQGNRLKLFSEWARHWDLRKPFLLEKSPPNIIRTRFLKAMFPSSSFVIIIRHPVPTAYATQRWRRTTLASLIDHWLVCHRTFCADRVHLGHDFVLRYEDFTRDPDSLLSSIYSFLGLPKAPRTVKVRGDLNEKYFRRWRDDLVGEPPDGPIHRLIREYEDRVGEFGYSLRDPSACGPFPQAPDQTGCRPDSTPRLDGPREHGFASSREGAGPSALTPPR